MIPKEFVEANDILKCPESIPDCTDLVIFRDPEKIISCWEITDEELAIIKETKQIWFASWGKTHPPVILTGHKPIFPPTPLNGQMHVER